MIKINKKIIALFFIPFLLTACSDRVDAIRVVDDGQSNKEETSKINNPLLSSTSSSAQLVGSKKYNNEKYGFWFSYPEYLKIVRDEGTDKEASSQNFWYLKMEGSAQDDVVNLSLDLTTKVAAKNMSELKEYKKLGFGGDLSIIGEEERGDGEKKFFIVEWKDSKGAIFIVASTLISPGVSVSIGASGFKDVVKAKELLYGVVDSFK